MNQDLNAETEKQIEDLLMTYKVSKQARLSQLCKRWQKHAYMWKKLTELESMFEFDSSQVWEKMVDVWYDGYVW